MLSLVITLFSMSSDPSALAMASWLNSIKWSFTKLNLCGKHENHRNYNKPMLWQSWDRYKMIIIYTNIYKSIFYATTWYGLYLQHLGCSLSLSLFFFLGGGIFNLSINLLWTTKNTQHKSHVKRPSIYTEVIVCAFYYVLRSQLLVLCKSSTERAGACTVSCSVHFVVNLILGWT